MIVDKKQTQRHLAKLRQLKVWQLLILLVFSLALSATFLRLNNVGMIKRRQAVLTADEAGDSATISDRLYDLQRYVSGHMNTDLGSGVYLENSYKKAVELAYQSQSSDNIYRAVQDVCEPRFQSYSSAYVECVTSELAKYPSANEVVLPDYRTYVYNFVSPVWSLDFAGFMVLTSVVILIIVIFRITGAVILKAILHHHKKSF